MHGIAASSSTPRNDEIYLFKIIKQNQYSKIKTSFNMHGIAASKSASLSKTGENPHTQKSPPPNE